MTPEKKLMGSLHRMAVRVLEASFGAGRDVRIARQSLKEAAAVAPVGGGFEEQYMIWLRVLV